MTAVVPDHGGPVRHAAGVLGQEMKAVDRPWGSFGVIAEQPEAVAAPRICGVKILIVNPGEMLSLQTHAFRAERWVAIDPGATATIDGATEYMVVGHAYDIDAGVEHRLANGSDRPVRVVEVMFGDYDEADVQRIQDVYGR